MSDGSLMSREYALSKEIPFMRDVRKISSVGWREMVFAGTEDRFVFCFFLDVVVSCLCVLLRR